MNMAINLAYNCLNVRVTDLLAVALETDDRLVEQFAEFFLKCRTPQVLGNNPAFTIE
jgi:hypothetical protein